MQNSTKRVWKKIGWFCYAFVPMIAYFVLSLIVSTAGSAALAFYGALKGVENIYEYVLGFMMILSAILAAVGLVVFGLWYYFGFGRPSLKPPAGVLNIKNLAALLCIAFGAQFVVTLIINGIEAIIPGATEAYVELMEAAGLDRMGWDVILYAVILGPMVEELVFRGLTFAIARRFTANFWVANVIQALTFGIMHGNVLQGIYAFFVGLLCGWVYYHFRSLYASMWFHICFNLLGTVAMDAIYGLLPDNMLTLLLTSAGGAAVCAAGIVVLKREKKGTGL